MHLRTHRGAGDGLVVHGLATMRTAHDLHRIGPTAVLTDEQVANVLTYVRNSWGNEDAPVTIDDVKRIRAEIAGSTGGGVGGGN